MVYKRIFYILFLLITLCTIYLFINRDGYRFIKQSAYSEIYPNYLLSIQAFKSINDSTVEVILNKSNLDSSNKSTILNLKKGIHDYVVVNKQGQDSLKVTIEYLATEDYEKQGNSLQGGITIYNSPLTQNSKETNLDKWRDDEITSTPLERNLVNELLKDSIKIDDKDNTVEKVRKIGTYLSFHLRNAVGLPTDSLLNLSVFNQYKCGIKGEKIWCGNYALIFMLFCKQAGVKTRYVEINKLYSVFPGNLHIFNEYFITEQGKWAAIDLLNNTLFYKNNYGDFLNAVQIKNANAADSSIKVFKATSDTSLAEVNFSSLPKSFFDTYNPTKELKFYLSLNYNESNNLFKKFKRYFQKKYYYELYSDSSIIDNKNFYIKQFLLFIQALCIVIFFIGLLAKPILNKK